MSDSKSKKEKSTGKNDKSQKGNEKKRESKDATVTKKLQNPPQKKPPAMVEAIKKQEVPKEDTINTFGNLKRDTDECLNITEKPNSKYAKRAIVSNWTKHELPINNYEIEDDNSHGSDFQNLLNMPISEGGHFQFKHEKSWNNKKKVSPYVDLFALDAKLLSSQLSCLSFYERNRLSPSLFSTEQVNRMKIAASNNKEKYEKNLPNTITKQNEDIRTENKKNYSTDSNNTTSKIVVDDISCITNKPTELDDLSISNLEKSVLDDDDELDDLLETVTHSLNIETKINEDLTPIVSSVEKSQSSELTVTQKVATDVDLDQWLDDYLES